MLSLCVKGETVPGRQIGGQICAARLSKIVQIIMTRVFLKLLENCLKINNFQKLLKKLLKKNSALRGENCLK